MNILKYIVTVTFIGLFFIGCSSGTTEKKPEKKEVLSMVTQAIKSLDSVRARDNASFNVILNAQETLMTYNHDVPEPAAALSYDVSPDGKTYTFHLRDGLKWSDGKPLTAQDFKYAWMRMLDPKVAADYSFFLFYVVNAEKYYLQKDGIKAEDVGISAPDDKTFVVKLIDPVPYFTQIAAFPALAPQRADMVEKAGETFGTKAEDIPYSGPYVVKSWQKGGTLIMEKNPNYWNAANIKVKTLKLSYIKEFNTQYQMFRDGQLDVVEGTTGEYIEKLKKGVAEKKWDHLHVVMPRIFYMAFNMKVKAFASKKVRMAFSLATDREEFVSKILKTNVPAYGFVSPGILIGDKSYRKEVKGPLRGIEVKDPKALLIEGLKEAGLDPDPSKYSFKFLQRKNSAEIKTQVEYIKNLWEQKLGVHIEIVPTADFSDYLQKEHNGEYDIAQSSWGADYNAPMTFLDLYTTWNSNNTGHYKNAEVDSLVKAIIAENDIAKRLDMYKKIEEIYVVGDPALIPLYYKDANTFYKPFVKGLQYASFGGLYQFRYVEFVEGK